MTNISKKSDPQDLLEELQRVQDEAIILKNIINQSPAIAFTWKNHHTWPVLFVSDNINQFGYNPEDFYSGRVKVLDVIHHEDRQRVLNEANQYAFHDRKREFSQECRFVKADGSWLWVDARILVCCDDSGNVSLFQGVFLDITEQKKAKENIEKANEAMIKQGELLRSAVDHIPSLVYVKDPQSRFKIANQAVVEIMGAISQDEIQNKTDFDYYPKEVAQPFYNDEQLLMAGLESVIDKEEHIPYHRGGMIWLHTIKRPLRNKAGETIGLIGLGYDITLRKKAEKENQKIIREAETANREKSYFLANMSHEIRTPLNGIIGMTSLLLDTNLDSTQRNYVTTLSSSGEFLLTIINDILDLSKIEAGKLELNIRDFNLREMLKTFFDVVSVKIHSKNVQLSVYVSPEVPSLLTGDDNRLQQILLNLAANGLKFTEQGEVDIRVLVESQNSTQILLRFEVHDTGIGISEKDKSILFQSFSQLDSSTTREFGGTGLGLAISKQLCEMMGGKIGVESTVGQGSMFWFNVFLKKQSNPSEVEQLTSYQSTNNPTVVDEPSNVEALPAGSKESILLAEDNHINQQVMVGILAKLGYVNVDIVTNGEKVLKALQKKQYSLILMDISMPVMDGLATTEIIRKSTFSLNSCEIPIVALTAHAIKGDREKCLDAGLDDYLTKPVSPDLLDRVLKKWLFKIVANGSSNRDCKPIKEQYNNEELSFNYNRLVERLLGSKTLTKEILTAFLDEAPRQVVSLKQSVEDNNIEEIVYHAHKFKGAAANMEANGITPILAQIEQFCTVYDSSHLGILISKLERQYELLEKAMARKLSQLSYGDK